MATIYRARDAQLDRDVAVKLLRPEFGQDPDFLARFRDEARAAASLNHPNIVSVFDFGEGDVRAVSRHGDRRGRGPRVDPARQRAARPAPGRARVGRGRRRPSRPRTSAGIVHRDVKPVEHPRRPRRADQGRRLRDRARAQRGAADAARHDDGLGPLLQPGAGARRARDRRLGHLRAGHRPVRDADRAAAVLRRRRRGRRARAPDHHAAPPVRAPPGRPARARRDRDQGDVARPGCPVRVGRRDGERARGLPDRRGRQHQGRAGRRRRCRSRGDRRCRDRAGPTRPPRSRIRPTPTRAPVRPRLDDERHAAAAARIRGG